MATSKEIHFVMKRKSTYVIKEDTRKERDLKTQHQQTTQFNKSYNLLDSRDEASSQF